MTGGETHAIIDLCAVIVATTQDTPSILVVQAGGQNALPSGPFDADAHATLDKGLHLWVREQTGLVLDYAEQLYTFGDKYRDPAEFDGAARAVSVGYVALVRADALAEGGDAAWLDWYDFFPWEDWRNGRPKLIENHILPRLERWIGEAKSGGQRDQRRDRVATTFGTSDAGWDLVRVLERYELLFQASCVAESLRDAAARGLPASSDADRAVADRLGRPMTRDHRRILATAISRIRGKLTYRPVVFDLLPHTFTLFQLQKTVEALSGTTLHKQNFRRMVITGKLVEPTGEMEQGGPGRPAELHRFRQEVMGEQLAPGVGRFGRR